jgi:hypothetical protein
MKIQSPLGKHFLIPKACLPEARRQASHYYSKNNKVMVEPAYGGVIQCRPFVNKFIKLTTIGWQT